MIPETFVNAGHLFEGQIALVDDEANASDAKSFGYQKAPGQELKNWTIMGIPEVTLILKFSSDPIDNGTAMAHYVFDNSTYHIDEDCEEDCELPEDLARLLRQESKVIQPH